MADDKIVVVRRFPEERGNPMQVILPPYLTLLAFLYRSGFTAAPGEEHGFYGSFFDGETEKANGQTGLSRLAFNGLLMDAAQERWDYKRPPLIETYDRTCVLRAGMTLPNAGDGTLGLTLEDVSGEHSLFDKVAISEFFASLSDKVTGGRFFALTLELTIAKTAFAESIVQGLLNESLKAFRRGYEHPSYADLPREQPVLVH